MIFDTQTLFSDQQAVTASARSENVLDLGDMGIPHGNKQAPARDIGEGTPLPLLVQVTEDFAGLTSLEIQVQTSDQSDFSSDVRLHASSGPVPVAKLKAGWKFGVTSLPVADKEGMGRYLSINYIKSGSDATAGKITAGLVAAVQTDG